jgi:hypothetical protein
VVKIAHGMSKLRRVFLAVVVCASLAAAALTPAALGADPGRWVETGHSIVPLEYFQGITSDRQRNLFFDGIFIGLYRTDSDLLEANRTDGVIPLDVILREGYNHIGDLTWDGREGGRLLLPLECFYIGIGNTCKTGSIGVADPVTLRWRYYVKLDPAFIDKAMWAEVSPNGKLLWTSSGSGRDLLAYDMNQITEANAAPDGPKLQPVRRLDGAVPPSGITGATFYKHKLLVATQTRKLFQVFSIDTDTGAQELEIERTVIGESEGLDIVKTLGGILHWQITPFGTGGLPATYGLGGTALVHYVPTHGGKGPET